MKKYTVILIIILLVGLFVRWGALSYICGPPVKSYPTMDEMNYRELAVNILDYRVFATWTEGFYTTSTRAPVYPMLIASAYSLSGNRSFYVTRIINLILDMLNIFLVFVLAWTLFNRNTALFSAAVYALYGHAVNYMTISSPHTLAVTLLLLVTIALVNLKHSYWPMVTLLSFFYALLIHTRPVFLLVTPFLLFAVYLQLSSSCKKQKIESEKSDKKELSCLTFRWKYKLIRIIIPAVMILLLLLPWGIRNYRQHKIIVPVCIIAGWHIATDPDSDLKLSIESLTRELYAPEHHGFSEADYFKDAEKKLANSFFHNPFKFTAYGIARLVYGWSPPGPLYRFLLPRAYVFPVKVFKGFRLPLPDFEGMLYIFVAITVIMFFITASGVSDVLLNILHKCRGLLMVIAGYSIAHIIGVPLTAYRFIIEPLIVVVFIGFTGSCLAVLFEKYKHLHKTDLKKKFLKTIAGIFGTEQKSEVQSNYQRINYITLYTVSAVFILLLFIPFVLPGNPKPHIYYALRRLPGVLDYTELRKMQWDNLGNITPETIVKLQGVVRYAHNDFRFIENDYYAEKYPDGSAARLYIRYGDKKHSLGIGDVRLNFKDHNIPTDGEFVVISGKAKTGPFKEIIIDVEKLKIIEQ